MPDKPSYKENEKKVLDLIKKGLIVKEIALELNLNKYQIFRILKNNNIENPSKKRSMELENKIIELFKTTSMSLKDISKEVNKSPARITQILKKCNIGVPTSRKNQAREKTCLKKYGAVNAMYNLEVQEKRTKYFIKKYGVDNPLKNKDIFNKGKETLYLRYGSRNPMQINEISKKVHKTRKEKLYNKYTFDNIEYTLSEACKQFGHSKSSFCKHYKELPKREFYKWLKKQEPHSQSSRAEKELFNYIKSIYKEEVYSRSKFGRKELDIYIPGIKLGVEYNGDFYHSILVRDKNYHIKKKKFFDDKGIELINIYECDWNVKKDLIKGFIRSRLNLVTKIAARKCKVKIIDNQTYRDFLADNHLQGYTYSKIKLGLFYKESLKAVMSFSKPRFEKKVEWELVRFCTKIDYKVIGGFSKLFKHFLVNYTPKSIISYSDRDLFSGKVYKSVGFKFSHNTNPSFFYAKGGVKYSRQKFQKHKLKNLLQEYDPKLSGQDNMINHGYLPIYTTGNSVYIWNIQV